MAKDKIPRNLSEGCKLCYQGAKLVLFISGLCDRTCWYCPLSEERKDVDVIFANDQKVTTPEEAIEEAEIMDALGTGVTGGEPLLVIERVVEFCTRGPRLGWFLEALGREETLARLAQMA